jgi:hypothetical protein
MKTRLLVALLLVTLVWPAGWMASAQEDGDDCIINLEETILALLQAQRQADTGNAFEAVQTLGDVQDALEALVAQCEGVLFPLPQHFMAPDESIAFDYPEDWVFLSFQQNAYLLASTREGANQMLENEMRAIPPGEQVLVVILVPAVEALEDGLTFDDIVNDFRDDDLDYAFDRVVGPAPIEVNGRSAVRLRVSTPEITGFFDIIDYIDADEPAVVAVAALAAPDEVALLEAVLEAFEKSVRYPGNPSLRVKGVPLDELAYDSGFSLDDLAADQDLILIPTLAPDGSAVAFIGDVGGEQGICLYSLADATTTCDLVPEAYRDRPRLLHWSPDSAYITFTSSYHRTFREPDIWIYDVAGRHMLNYTDDGVIKWNPLRGSDEPGPIWIDSVVTWGPDGNLYFLRDTLQSSSDQLADATTGLYRLSPEGGEPALIRDLTGVWGIASLYDISSYSFEGAMSVSPDASQIAFIIRENEYDAYRNGIWVMALDGMQPPRQVAGFDGVMGGLSLMSDAYGRLYPVGVAWDEAGTGLYVLSSASGFAVEVGMVIHLDLATGRATPMIDYSGVDMTTLGEEDADSRAVETIAPRLATLAPDASGVLAVRVYDGTVGLSSLRLVDGEVEEVLLTESEFFPPRDSTFIATVGQDGTLLAYHTLFVPAAPE